jgi:hypothetical protein
VIEASSYPLIGWAMETKALNLVTGEPTADTRTDYQRKELDRIRFYGNNNWTKGFGADQTLLTLRDLLHDDPLPADVIVGSILARGQHGGRVETPRRADEADCLSARTVGRDKPRYLFRVPVTAGSQVTRPGVTQAPCRRHYPGVLSPGPSGGGGPLIGTRHRL